MKKIDIKDMLHYKSPANLQYSPDGKLLAFEVISADEKKNAYHTDVHLLKGSKDLQLTSTLDASLLAWDNNETLILSRKTPDTEAGTTELYKIRVDGGEAVRWITVGAGVRSLKKVRDNVYALLVGIEVGDPDAYMNTAEQRKAKQDKKKEEHEENYQVVDEVPYWFNGAGFTNGQRTALFLLKDGELKRITAPAFSVDSFEINADKVYYIGNTFAGSQSLYSNLYVLDTKTGEVKDIYTKNDRSIGSIFFLDGKLFIQETDMKEYGVNETARLSKVEEQSLTELYKPEISLYNSMVGDTLMGGGKGHTVSGAQYYTLATREDHSELIRFDENMKWETVYKAKGMIGSFDTNGKKIAFIGEDWEHLGEIYLMDMDGSNVHRVTVLNEEALAGKYIAEPKRLDYTSGEDELHGWVLLPENYDPSGKYPAVLDVHGGPRCVYGEIFFHEMQVWAAKGYIVMFTNIRGSDGRGDAFADIRDQYGFEDYQNLMDFTDAVLDAYPGIDRTRLCETGGSYGGFMSNWIMTHTDRFCAIASQRSISNWISMSFTSDIGLYFGPDQCGGDGLFGCSNTEKLWNHSPLKYAANAHTPALFIHSDQDYRCPLPEGMQMMQALASRNVETRMVIFHGENHDLSRSGKPLGRIRRLTEITEWFEKHTR